MKLKAQISSKVSFETVREVGVKLPLVEVGTAYGKPALKVHGKTFVTMASHKSAEPDSLMVRVDLDQRAELLDHDPSVYYITEHYENYPAVLVRLSCVTTRVLADLLGMAYRLVVGEIAGKGKSALSGPIKTRKR